MPKTTTLVQVGKQWMMWPKKTLGPERLSARLGVFHHYDR